MTKFTISEEDLEDGTLGICLKCGNVQCGVEPDAENYECEACKEAEVCGMEQALLMGRVELIEDEDE
jgi:hypothetical protein